MELHAIPIMRAAMGTTRPPIITMEVQGSDEGRNALPNVRTVSVARRDARIPAESGHETCAEVDHGTDRRMPHEAHGRVEIGCSRSF